jgi:chromosome segregation ATPase
MKKATKYLEDANNSRLTAKQQVSWALWGGGAIGGVGGGVIGGMISGVFIGIASGVIGLAVGGLAGMIVTFFIWAAEKFNTSEEMEPPLDSAQKQAKIECEQALESVNHIHVSVQQQTKDMQELHTHLNKTEDDLKQTNEDIDRLTNLLTTLDNTEQNLTEKVELIAVKTADLSAQTRPIQSINLALDAENESLNLSNTQQEALRHQINARIEDLLNTCIELEKEKFALKNHHTQQEQMNLLMQSQITTLESQYAALQQTKEQSEYELEEQKVTNEHLLTRISVLQTDYLELKQKKGQHTDAQKALNNLLKKYNELEQHEVTLEHENQEQKQKITALTTLVNSLNEQGEKLQKNIKSLKNTYAELEQTNDDLKREVNTWEDKCRIQEQQYELLNQQFNEQGILITEQDQSIKHMTITLEEQDELMGELMSELEIKKKELERLKTQQLALTNRAGFFQKTPANQEDANSAHPNQAMK